MAARAPVQKRRMIFLKSQSSLPDGDSFRQTMRILPMSSRLALPGAVDVGPTDDHEEIQVTMVLRRAASSELSGYLETLDSLPISERTFLSRESFAQKYGATDEDVAAVTGYAEACGLVVTRVLRAAGTVVLAGTVGNFNRAFLLELRNYDHPDGTYRGYTGSVSLPTSLSDRISAVLGLDSRPQARPHLRMRNAGVTSEEGWHSRAAATALVLSYTPPQVAELYQYPNDVPCSDQCVGIIELGGGYTESNLKDYFSALGLPMPRVATVTVDGGVNQPGSPNGPDGEVNLDIEVVASVAPGVQVVVYFTPNTDAGFLNAITMAMHDTTYRPTVLSISWGGPEDSWSMSSLQAMNSALADGRLLGVSVCVAAGDSGSTDGVDDGRYHVDFPASSPHVLACGGTRLVGSGSVIDSETVWNDGLMGGATGGGVSSVFAVPSWQEGAGVPPSANPGGVRGRGVPDVAGNADPETGYQILVDGQSMVVGGTSAVAPLWAGLLVLTQQMTGHLTGFMNPFLYGISPAIHAFREITHGNNDIQGTSDVYSAGPGWNCCTGLGSPKGGTLIQSFLDSLRSAN